MPTTKATRGRPTTPMQPEISDSGLRAVGRFIDLVRFSESQDFHRAAEAIDALRSMGVEVRLVQKAEG